MLGIYHRQSDSETEKTKKIRSACHTTDLRNWNNKGGNFNTIILLLLWIANWLFWFFPWLRFEILGRSVASRSTTESSRYLFWHWTQRQIRYAHSWYRIVDDSFCVVYWPMMDQDCEIGMWQWLQSLRPLIFLHWSSVCRSYMRLLCYAQDARSLPVSKGNALPDIRLPLSTCWSMRLTSDSVLLSLWLSVLNVLFLHSIDRQNCRIL